MMEEDEDKDKEVEFSSFINCCADTLQYALNISDDRWTKASGLDIHNKMVDLVNDVVMSVIGNKNLREIDFQKVDYDLMFVATLRKALSLATSSEEL